MTSDMWDYAIAAAQGGFLICVLLWFAVEIISLAYYYIRLLIG